MRSLLHHKWNVINCLFVVSFVQILQLVNAGEMTFELEDNSKQCFYEEIQKDVQFRFEYQVVTGGSYDVDLVISDPNSEELYNKQKEQYDSVELTAAQRGIYSFCFSNEFSTFAHKVVYFDFSMGNEDPIVPSSEDHHTALTQMESSAIRIHELMNVVTDDQTHHRLREAQGRSFAEDLNVRVQMWSIGQTVFILLIGVGQIVILRSFFADHKSKRSAMG